MMFERLFRQKRTRVELDLTDVQIDQLRTVVDGLPLDPYASLVVAVLKKLPLESDAVPPNSGADADLRTLTPSGSAGGFSLLAFNPKDAAAVRKIEQQLARLPHTGDSL